ncbi:MAG: GDSL-type esterase/lipase family protein [Sphingomonadales bacterium]|jgi:lysophospholipase L1-like esterase
MIWQSVAIDDAALGRRGAADWRQAGDGLRPHRLPAWTDAQMPDPALQLMAAMASGVRLVLRSDTRALQLDVECTGFEVEGTAPRPVVFDLLVDGRLHARRHDGNAATLIVGTPPAVRLAPGSASVLDFGALPEGEKTIEIWLPHAAQLAVRGLRLSAGASLSAAPAGRRWEHYGSSISHAMDADGPSETWPALAARARGLDLQLLGFAGQCLLDSLVARSIAATPADVISLKLGINIVNQDAMRERSFVAAVHGFLDTIRDAQPDVPILIISPIHCAMAETAPGPTLRRVSDGRVQFFHSERPAALAAGALTLVRIRELLAAIVARRRDANLRYVDGLQLFGAGDAPLLHDGLHPDAQGQRLLAERFLARMGDNWPGRTDDAG